MLSQEAGPRIIVRLFRADGDHITALGIPAFDRPVDVLLWHFRAFQYNGAEASSRLVYFLTCSPLRYRRPP